MHYSKSKEDFEYRLEKLTDEELDYLICLAESGEESLTCIRPEHKEAFIEIVAKRISKERAAKLQKFINFLETQG
jgi:DNA-binding MarR family transcriptional regulator